MRRSETYNDGSNVSQVILRLNPDIKQEFYIKCIKDNTSMQTVLGKFVEKYVKEN